MDGVSAVVDEVLGVGPASPVWALSDAALVEHFDLLQAYAQRLTAAQLVLLREIEGRGIPKAQGAASATAWLRDRHRIGGSAASRLVKLAAATGDDRLPATTAALAEGTVNLEQVQVIGSAIADLPADRRAEGEQFLLEQAKMFGPRELGVLGERLFQILDLDEADRRDAARLAKQEAQAHERRYLTFSDVPGTADVRLFARMSREDAAQIRATVDALSSLRIPNRAADGGGDGAVDLRTPGQRRIDALVEMSRIASACGELPDNGGDRPQLTLTMDLDKLRDAIGMATLDDGTHLSATTARRIACDAAIIPAVLGTAGQVLDLGRERRLFTGPIRRALILRDRGCAFPGCDRPPRWCSGHHISHWIDGGRTDLSNGVLVCGHHHRLLHHSDWQVRINPTDGLPEFIPPAYIDPQQRPQRNRYHRRE